jgi:acyl-CoA synthetase (AMP-forming)/AMP-acid ligase II
MDYEISVLLGNQSRVPARCPLRDYLEAFVGHMKDPFLTHYDFLSGGISTNSSRSIASETYTRGGFWNLTLKCVSALMRCGVERGHKHVHYFGGNTVYDLALRLASVILGSIPVTVNWQADNFDLVCYKIEITSAKVVFVDERTPNVEEIQSRFPNVKIVTTENIACTISYGGNFTDISTTNGASYVGYEDTRCIIFTSGTTGRPKGVELTYSNYHCNRATFESFLGLTDEDVRFIPIVVNPMHHTNSTSITDWALRRPGSHVHLLDRYTTQYWDVLIQVHAGLRGDVDDTSGASVDGRSYRVIAPLVSRHIDFLDSLMQSGHFADAKELTSSLCLSTLLLGSAPVGPTTCHRLMKHAGHLPTVRFGSTETTLQVCGIPHELSDDAIMAAFERGWNHTVNKSHAPPSACPAAKTSEIPAITEASPGYYIGRDHFPFTEVRVVASVNPEDSDNYLKVMTLWFYDAAP